MWSLGYYVNAAGYATGAISVLEYDTYFGVLNYGEHEAEQWISSHNLVGSTAMLWTNLAWPLVDEQLVPPTRSGPLYITLALENGTAGILSRMNASPPEADPGDAVPHREPDVMCAPSSAPTTT